MKNQRCRLALPLADSSVPDGRGCRLGQRLADASVSAGRAPYSTNKRILLTGGAGIVGRALLEKLSDSTVVCLVHQTPVTSSNAISLSGDIRCSRLGLTGSEFKKLATDIDCIIHAAAITNFSQPEHEIFRTNVAGTANVLELAAMAQAPIYYISTAFAPLPTPNNSSVAFNSYEVSKCRAEQLVEKSGLPHTIVRPSIIVGDSKTGAISSFQGLHLFMGLFMRGFLPLIPASPDSYIDFVPQDLVAEAIVALIEHGEAGGRYWLTAGQCALRLQNVVDLCIAHARDFMGRTIDQPRMVSPDVFERLIRPVFLPALPPRRRRVIERTIQFVKYFNIDRPFSSSFHELEKKLNIHSPSHLERTWVANLGYWANQNGFTKKNPLHSVDWAYSQMRRAVTQ